MQELNEAGGFSPVTEDTVNLASQDENAKDFFASRVQASDRSLPCYICNSCEQ